MKEFNGNDEIRKKQLEEKILNLPKKKWQILRLVVLGIFFPFVAPYIPMRRGSLEERMGYEDAVWMFAALVIIFFPLACYMHIKKVNDEIFEAELQLHILNRSNSIAEQLEDFKKPVKPKSLL